VKKKVGQRNSHEQQQRRLNHGSEDARLSHRQRGTDTTQGEEGGERGAEFLVAGTGLDRHTEQRRAHRDQHRSPPRHSRTSGERGSQIVCGRALGWHS